MAAPIVQIFAERIAEVNRGNAKCSENFYFPPFFRIKQSQGKGYDRIPENFLQVFLQGRKNIATGIHTIEWKIRHREKYEE